MKKTDLLLSALLFATPAIAEEPNFSFVEVGYSNSQFRQNLDFKGLVIRGGHKFSNGILLRARITSEAETEDDYYYDQTIVWANAMYGVGYAFTFDSQAIYGVAELGTWNETISDDDYADFDMDKVATTANYGIGYKATFSIFEGQLEVSLYNLNYSNK
jgi:hypothetical protein